MRATGFDNYYKIPVRDHVCGTKFWHIHVRVQIYIYIKKDIKCHNFYLVIFLTICPKLILTLTE